MTEKSSLPGPTEPVTIQKVVFFEQKGVERRVFLTKTFVLKFGAKYIAYSHTLFAYSKCFLFGMSRYGVPLTIFQFRCFLCCTWSSLLYTLS
jgi:hypothetical protein